MIVFYYYNIQYSYEIHLSIGYTVAILYLKFKNFNFIKLDINICDDLSE